MALQVDEMALRDVPAYRPRQSQRLHGGKYQLERTVHITGARALAWGYQRELDRRVLIERIAGLDATVLHQALARRDALLALEHPQLARCIDIFVEADALHLVLTPGVGQLLAEVTGAFSTSDILTVGIQMCNILNFARRQSNLYEDIVVEPSTVVMTRGGRVKLSSMAALIGIATPRYRSRFVGNGGTSASRAAFSIGATLHFLLTGWSGSYREGPPSLTASRPDLSPDYVAAIMRAVHPDPRQRWADSAALRYALLPLLG